MCKTPSIDELQHMEQPRRCSAEMGDGLPRQGAHCNDKFDRRFDNGKSIHA